MSKEEIEKAIADHERVIAGLNMDMSRNINSSRRSMTKGSFLNGQIGYHQRKIKELKIQLEDATRLPEM